MTVWNHTFCLRLRWPYSIHCRSPVSGGSRALRIHPAGNLHDTAIARR
jgi:hypothetical protein